MGGAERVLEALLEDLPQRGIAVKLLCLREPGPIGEALRARGLPLRSHLCHGRFDLRAIARIRAEIQSSGARLLYVLDHSNALFLGRIAARQARLPAVVAVHRTGRADGTRSLSWLDRLLLPWTARVIAVSEGHAAYLHEREGIPSAKLVTIHNGIDPASFTGVPPAALGLSALSRVICQVAALRPEKHHALTLSALATLPAPERPILLLVGDGPERARIAADVARRGLAPWVRLLGRRADVASLLAASDLLVLSSHPRVETFPLCVLEAMAAGRAVLATDVGSLREMVVEGETALLTPPGDVLAFASALRELLADPDRRARMGQAGRARLVGNFTRARMVERTATLLLDLIGR